jgi:hypothetical protein
MIVRLYLEGKLRLDEILVSEGTAQGIGAFLFFRRLSICKLGDPNSEFRVIIPDQPAIVPSA